MNKHTSNDTTLIREEHAKDGGAEYTYMLTMRRSNMVASYRMQLYSLTVRMTMPDGRQTEATASDAFSDARRAHRFFDLMLRELVTPIDLPYVLEDMISAV